MGVIKFWDTAILDADLRELHSASVAVKGTSCCNPLRLMEIYGNNELDSTLSLSEAIGYLPRIPSVQVQLGYGAYHPPFTWGDCDPKAIAINFTYTTNAAYRILNNLSKAGIIQKQHVDLLLDRVCLRLTSIYKAEKHRIIKGINNNLNMYLVSKVVESIVGVAVYDCEYQEIERTRCALERGINMAKEHMDLTPKQQMAIALGKGIAFLERHDGVGHLDRISLLEVREICYRYKENNLAIDDRDKLINRVAASNEAGCAITMCAILDDTAETVDDLLWIQQLLELYPLFRVNLLVNRAQISVNFASNMLHTIFESAIFRSLACRVGKQLLVTETYCPLISFQQNLLDTAAKESIETADFVFIKGLNFFETCQLREKDAYYSFVVYGPISQLYTGLPDLSGVFAYLPKGTTGYSHARDTSQIQTLIDIHGETDVAA